MSQALPETVDPWRMVQARRHFEGTLRLAAMPRLAADLAAPEGGARFDLEFGTDEFGVAYLHLRAEAALPLTCQRSLDVFALPVSIDTRLGLIKQEADEAALPPGYEPLLVSDGVLRPADVIEDELILALPLVPVKPGSTHIERSWGDESDAAVDDQPNPFAALEKMKGSR
jgi:uncharacterized protein